MPDPGRADSGQDGRAAAIAAMTEDERRRGFPAVLRYGAAAVVLVVVAAVFGALDPPRPGLISTDRLGPESGQPVADYLARARDSLAGPDDGDRWALVSFTEEVRAERIPVVAAGLRVGQALYRVPIPDVQTPIVAVQLPAGDAVAAASAADAAWQLHAERDRTAEGRYRLVLTVSIDRLRADCACAVGLVVRGPLSRLAALASAPGVRAVEALPADAVAEAFAVNPLLPSQKDFALPGPDTGPVPEP